MAATKKYPQVYQYREKESVGGAPTFENIGLNPSVVTETDGEEASRSSIKMGEHNVPGTVSRGSLKSEKTFFHFLGQSPNETRQTLILNPALNKQNKKFNLYGQYGKNYQNIKKEDRELDVQSFAKIESTQEFKVNPSLVSLALSSTNM